MSKPKKINCRAQFDFEFKTPQNKKQTNSILVLTLLHSDFNCSKALNVLELNFAFRKFKKIIYEVFCDCYRQPFALLRLMPFLSYKLSYLEKESRILLYKVKTKTDN